MSVTQTQVFTLLRSALAPLTVALVLAVRLSASPTLQITGPAPGIHVKPGTSIDFTLSQDNLDAPGCAGYQAFVAYDPQKLTFVSGSYTAQPYPVVLQNNILAQVGNLSLAAGITPGGQQTTLVSDLAYLHFQAGPQEGSVRLAFRTGSPASQFSSFNGAVPATLVDGPEIVVDASGPDLSAFIRPPAALAGQQIRIEVTATDGAGVSQVLLDGQPMTLENGIWVFSATADPIQGVHSFGLQATDGLGNVSVGSASYTTATPTYINNRDASNPPAELAASSHVFSLVGRATSVTGAGFVLDDASGYLIRVDAQGHNVSSGALVRADGWLEHTSPTPTLHSRSQYITVLH
ncbi:MAG: hypothetical protein IT209_08835 [Armatimonadetes bacterium]|nr:hypothetical protein [Armatimonadota bacterium]